MYMDYPWYFETNHVFDAWALTQGGGAVVDLVDSCVDFSSHSLQGKEYGSHTACAPVNDLYSIHGTAMAGLIVAAHDREIPKNNTVDEFLNIAGIAPKSLIKNAVEDHTTKKLEVTKNAFKEAQEEKDIPITKYGKPYLKEIERPDLILINLSGATIVEKGTDIYATEKTDWLDLVKRVCEDKYSLLIASVGNGGYELGKNYEYLPAALRLKTCGEFDPIIRVGAVAEHKVGANPSIYYNSNYGSKYVDILAPGSNIPILIPGDKAIIGGGTSEAAAITSATAALLIGCHPKATAHEIKNAILDYASSFDSLKNEVLYGRVLNIKETISSFCINKKTKPTPEDSSITTMMMTAIAAVVLTSAGLLCIKTRTRAQN